MKILIYILIILFGGTVCFASEVPQISGEEEFNTVVQEVSTGEFSFDIGELINNFFNTVLSEIKENAALIGSFLIIAAISAIVNLIEFKDRGIAEAAFFACYTMCAGSAIGCFSNILQYAEEVTDSMGDFITKLSPVLTGLLITSGKAASASAFHPVLYGGVYVVTVIVKKCIIPLAVYSSVLSIASNISEQVQISGFCKLIGSISKWILAASFTLFTGICGIYGFSAPALDVLGARTAKFAVGSLVPVVGGFLADTLETVISGSRLMKNAVGTAGLVTLCGICIIPVIKIGVMVFSLKIAGAIAEPITDSRISRLLYDMADAASIIMGMTITITVLFIICISIILAATN